jgi:hypothetical protein
MPRSGQPELFEAQRQVRRLSGGELIQVKAPAVASERNGFPEKHCFQPRRFVVFFSNILNSRR